MPLSQRATPDYASYTPPKSSAIIVAVTFSTSEKPYYYWYDIGVHGPLRTGNTILVNTPTSTDERVVVRRLYHNGLAPQVLQELNRPLKAARGRLEGALRRFDAETRADWIYRHELLCMRNGLPWFAAVAQSTLPGEEEKRSALARLKHMESHGEHDEDEPTIHPTNERGWTPSNIPKIPHCPNTKENVMQSIEFKSEHFVVVNGEKVSVDQLNENAVFKLIADAEKEIKELEKIEHKPKALQRRIDNLGAGIEGLVKLLDAREKEEPAA